MTVNIEEHTAKTKSQNDINVFADLVNKQRVCLESILGEHWLCQRARERTDHLGARQWVACKQLCGNAIRSYMTPEALVGLIFPMMTDVFHISAASGGQFESFSMGDFTNYGDETVRSRVVTEARTSIGYRSVMAELGYAGVQVAKGRRVTAFQDHGAADLLVEPDSDLTFPLLVECKSMDESQNIRTNPRNKITASIRKINSQIKTLSRTTKKGFGLGGIDVTRLVNPKGAVLKLTQSENEIFEHVDKLEDYAKHCLVQKNSSVNAVILQWNVVKLELAHPALKWSPFPGQLGMLQ